MELGAVATPEGDCHPRRDEAAKRKISEEAREAHPRKGGRLWGAQSLIHGHADEDGRGGRQVGDGVDVGGVADQQRAQGNLKHSDLPHDRERLGVELLLVHAVALEVLGRRNVGKGARGGEDARADLGDGGDVGVVSLHVG